jgi:hypothetical protein
LYVEHANKRKICTMIIVTAGHLNPPKIRLHPVVDDVSPTGRSIAAMETNDMVSFTQVGRSEWLRHYSHQRRLSWLPFRQGYSTNHNHPISTIHPNSLENCILRLKRPYVCLRSLMLRHDSSLRTVEANAAMWPPCTCSCLINSISNIVPPKTSL